jgi:hypothetical protein
MAYDLMMRVIQAVSHRGREVEATRVSTVLACSRVDRTIVRNKGRSCDVRTDGVLVYVVQLLLEHGVRWWAHLEPMAPLADVIDFLDTRMLMKLYSECLSQIPRVVLLSPYGKA